MSSQDFLRNIPTLESGISITSSISHAFDHPERESRPNTSQGENQADVLIDPYVNRSFMTPDRRLLLSPCSSNSQSNTRESSLPSSREPDQSSQSAYSHSPTEYHQPAYPLAERASKALGAALGEQGSSTARQGELLTHPMQTPRRRGIPLGFDNLLHPVEQSEQTPVERTLADVVPPNASIALSRFRLHIRQQPIATRACAAGEKDRRPVDPPPILQMLLADFNPSSETDQAILQNPQYVVGCLLYSVERSFERDGGEQEMLVHSSHVVETTRKRQRDSPRHQLNSPPASLEQNQEQQQQQPRRYVQILSGRTYVSPFYAPYDPDPETAPEHPRTSPRQQGHPDHRRHTHTTDSHQMPVTFFVFPDLSVRAAGIYRLRFRLMDWGITAETGTAQPILAETFSEPFRVYTSKDFPGMRNSSALTWGLRNMGMLQLKPRQGKGKEKGKGKGKGKEKHQD